MRSTNWRCRLKSGFKIAAANARRFCASRNNGMWPHLVLKTTVAELLASISRHCHISFSSRWRSAWLRRGRRTSPPTAARRRTSDGAVLRRRRRRRRRRRVSTLRRAGATATAIRGTSGRGRVAIRPQTPCTGRRSTAVSGTGQNDVQRLSSTPVNATATPATVTTRRHCSRVHCGRTTSIAATRRSILSDPLQCSWYLRHLPSKPPSSLITPERAICNLLV